MTWINHVKNTIPPTIYVYFVYQQVEKTNKYISLKVIKIHLRSLMGGFLYFNCYDYILLKSTNKIIETAR